MDFIYCGIKFKSPRNFERIRVDNVNFNENSAALKERVKNEILDKTKDEISLVYCGNILEDDEPIKKYVLHSGSTVHVLRKSPEEQIKEVPAKFTELDVSSVCSLYRALNSGNFHKISRTEVITQIFSKHPELKKDIIALSFLKDPILLSNLQNPDTVRKMAENHRVLIDASETICKALRTNVKVASEQPSTTTSRQQALEDLSDSSSSSGSETISPQASTSNAAARRITSDFLRRSLAAAQQNQNSLANISQRNLSQDGSNLISPSSSSSSIPARRNFISNSMVMNAMNEVLRARRSEQDLPGRNSLSSVNDQETPEQLPEQEEEEQTPEAERMEEDESARDARDIEMIASFQNQLRQMEDMGLTNKATNIQALMVCNGNLEAAVNLVLAEMNMS